jgi:CspA family cold shock protein
LNTRGRKRALNILGGLGTTMLMDQRSDTGDVMEPVEVIIVHGTVKWFDGAKGYGFISRPDGSEDVLLHLSVLRQAGIDIVQEGTTVHCEAVRRAKGLQALKVVSVDASTAITPDRSGRVAPRAIPVEQVLAQGDLEPAMVKWFNRIRGYGFISRGEGTQDIFVHMETLRRAGLAELHPGQPVRVRITDGAKGPQVADLLIEDD